MFFCDICDIPECHKMSQKNLWLAQTRLCFMFWIRLGTTLKMKRKREKEGNKDILDDLIVFNHVSKLPLDVLLLVLSDCFRHGIFSKEICTANPTWGDIFESSKLKARKSLLPHFSEKRRSGCELWALSFELWNSIRKCHPKWDRLYKSYKIWCATATWL